MQREKQMSSVVAVSLSGKHALTKGVQEKIYVLKGFGVEGDVHAGVSVKHRSRVARDPSQPNLRQVHLMHRELFEELKEAEFSIVAGQMGENITTQGIDLLSLPTGARLRLGDEAVIEITGLRNPCTQLNQLQEGLMAAVLDRDEEGNLVRKAGVMAVVVESGVVRPGDSIVVYLPLEPHIPLKPV